MSIETDSETIRTRVRAFIDARQPKPVCARCVGAALEIRPTAAQRVATYLEGNPAYHRHHTICGLCGARRLAIEKRGRSER